MLVISEKPFMIAMFRYGAVYLKTQPARLYLRAVFLDSVVQRICLGFQLIDAGSQTVRLVSQAEN